MIFEELVIETVAFFERFSTSVRKKPSLKPFLEVCQMGEETLMF